MSKTSMKLITPFIPLGIKLEEGLEIIKPLGEIIETNENVHSFNEHSFRVNTEYFEIAIYEKDGLINSVWYNDPLGREKGEPADLMAKIELYLKRYGDYKNWEFRNDNGYMLFWFNDVDRLAMLYGLHADVIRFHKRPPIEE